jgi:hypothetical protein
MRDRPFGRIQLSVALLSVLTGCAQDHYVDDKGQEATEVANEILAIADDAYRIELEVTIHLERGNLYRVSPIVVTDKTTIQKIVSEIRRIRELANNPFPFKDSLAGDGARICFVSSNARAARVRLNGNRFLALSSEEKFAGMLPDDALYEELRALAESHARICPEDAIEIPGD